MKSVLDGFILALGGSLAASIVAKATVIVALGLIGARLARRSSAAIRHLVLASTFAVLLLLPLASLIEPAVPIAVPAAAEVVRASSPVRNTGTVPRLAVQGGEATNTPVAPRSSLPSPTEVLFAVWLAGLALTLAPLVAGLRKVRQARSTSLPWDHGQSIVDRLRLEAGIGRHVVLLLHEALPGPTVSGTLRPVILLPQDAPQWNREELNRALVHELEHVRRGDSIINLLARAVCAVYWFHPLVWIARRQLALEAERSCDDAVLRHSEATAYAEQLVGLARRLSMAAKSPLLAMANRADLAIRVSAVLDSRQHRGRAGMLRVVAGTVVAALLVLTMSPLKTVSAPQSAPAGSSESGAPPAFKVVSVSRSHPAENSNRGIAPDGLTLINLPPEELIEIAYGHDFGDFGFRPLKNDQLVGGPSWARNWLGPNGLNYEGYDVEAKVDDSLARQFGEDSNGHGFWNGRCSYRHEMLLMFQSLLARRFKLKVRHETREVLIYALVAARSGPTVLHENPAQTSAPCPAAMHCLQGYISMARLADWLSGPLDRPVKDETGLKGGYSIRLKWPRKPAVAGTHIAPEFASRASLFSALQQQLGLKLEPTQGKIDFLVVDHIERPSEN